MFTWKSFCRIRRNICSHDQVHPPDQSVAVDQAACICICRCTRLTSQLLLTGLLACATIAFLYTLAPTHTSCALIRFFLFLWRSHFFTLLRFGSGLSYSIVYSTLLVKLIFLICLNSGIYLTAAYQAVLLFFAILIQLAIGELFSISPLMFNHLFGGFDLHNQTLPHLIFDHSSQCLFQTLKPGHQ